MSLFDIERGDRSRMSAKETALEKVVIVGIRLAMFVSLFLEYLLSLREHLVGYHGRVLSCDPPVFTFYFSRIVAISEHIPIGTARGDRSYAFRSDERNPLLIAHTGNVCNGVLSCKKKVP